jgi:hypothetical protein
MKTFKISLPAIIFSLIVFTISCENNDPPQKGEMEFSVEMNAGSLKSMELIDSSDVFYTWHIMVSVANENGEYVMEDELIPLHGFGSGYVTGKLEIEAGKYTLEKFMVVGPRGNILYASPLKASSKAMLVDRPLPIIFKVIPGEVVRVVPQVLPVGDSNPVDFGYVSFGFDVVNPVVAYVAAIDGSSDHNIEPDFISAQMTVFTPDGKIMEYPLRAKVNKLLLKPGYNSYHVIVEKPGYPPFEMEIAAEELRNSTPNRPYLFFLGTNNINTLIIQPGPEAGKDAMITNLDQSVNFGDHKFFEASFLSEPVLTVMRTKRSLMHFNLDDKLPENARIESVMLELHLMSLLWDSIYQADELNTWDNRLVLRQIIQPWEENEVTWENQPETIPANEVFIQPQPHLSTNKRVYDVTTLFVPFAEVAAPNHGFMLMHPDGDNPAPGGFRFGSSDHPKEYMRPRLVVKYLE